MKLIEINTTAYDEENFYVLTNINTEQLTNEIYDYIKDKRDNDIDYDNKEIEQHIQQHFVLCNNNYFEIREIEYIEV